MSTIGFGTCKTNRKWVSEKNGKEKYKSEKSSENHPIKTENDVYKVYWKNQEVGEYIGPGASKQFKSFNEIQPNSTDLRCAVGIKKSTPIIKLNLFNRFSNWCVCGETELTKKIHKICKWNILRNRTTN